MKRGWIIRAWNIPYSFPSTGDITIDEHCYIRKTKLFATFCVLRCRLLFDHVEVIPR